MAEGDGSSKNFRSAYYEKLGFCGNEEKNILDLLIASCPFDSEKLNDLCDRFDLDRRCVETWKILLGKFNLFQSHCHSLPTTFKVLTVSIFLRKQELNVIERTHSMSMQM